MGYCGFYLLWILSTFTSQLTCGQEVYYAQCTGKRDQGWLIYWNRTGTYREKHWMNKGQRRQVFRRFTIEDRQCRRKGL